MMPLESRLEAAEAKVSAVDAERGAAERKAVELERRRGELRQIIKDTGSFVDARTMSQLERLGFRCVSGNKHWKLDYADVRRLGMHLRCRRPTQDRILERRAARHQLLRSTIVQLNAHALLALASQLYGAFETLAGISPPL